jgi:hypothetical protein
MAQGKYRWYFITHESKLEEEVALVIVDEESNRSIGQIEISIEMLLGLLNTAANCEDWYNVTNNACADKINKTPLLWELEDIGDLINYKLVGMLRDGYDKKEIFHREPLVTIKRSG